MDRRARQHAREAVRGLRLISCLLPCLWLMGCPLGFDVAENGGIGGTGISQGPISGFGSIFVNGIEWETGAAQIDIDGVPSVQEALRLGMVVRVEGTISGDGLHGRALRVVFDDDVEGPIQGPVLETVAGVEKRFSVLGRSVIVEVGFTRFDGTARFAALSPDDMVEVSGLIDADGSLRATRIDGRNVFEPGRSHAELHGRPASFVPDDAVAGVFALGGVSIRYDAATRFDGLAPADLAGAPHVEVGGVLESVDAIRAERIELESDGFQGEEGEEVDLTGFVTQFVSVADFRVFGVAVDASMAKIEGDLVLGDGVLVEVEGRLVGGILVAEKVEEVDDKDAEVSIGATVSAIDPAKRELQILGLTVRANGKTRIEDDFLDLPTFGFADIAVGDWLEIRGREIGGTSPRVMASGITRRVAEPDTILQGRVTFHDLAQRQISIVGVALPGLDLSGGTRFFDELGQDVDVQQFIALLTSGGEIVVRARDLGASDPSAIGELDELEFVWALDDEDDEDD